MTMERHLGRLTVPDESLEANAELLKAIVATTYSKNSPAVIHAPPAPVLRRVDLLGMRRLMLTPVAGTAA